VPRRYSDFKEPSRGGNAGLPIYRARALLELIWRSAKFQIWGFSGKVGRKKSVFAEIAQRLALRAFGKKRAFLQLW